MINTNRQIITDTLNGQNDKLLVIIGPCSDQDSDVITNEAMRLASLSDKNTIYVHRTPPWKPRTSPQDWHGLDETDPHLALNRKRHHGSLGVPVAMEYGLTSHDIYADNLSFMWIGSRAVEDTVLLDRALKHTDISLGIKNGMDGSTEAALKKVDLANATRKRLDANAAPVVLIFRGGQNLNNPDLWEQEYLKAYEATGGNIIVDSAHGGEMAHDPGRNFAKSVLGQLACLEHIKYLSAAGFAPRGVMIEASDVVITDKTRQTDPNIPFNDALKNVNEIINSYVSIKSMIS